MSSRRRTTTRNAQRRRGANNKKYSKVIERRVAELCGDRRYRVPDGANKTADVIVPGRLVVEVKSTRSFGPSWLSKAATQIKRAMVEENLPGVIAFSCINKETGERREWAVMPFDEWFEVFSELEARLLTEAREVATLTGHDQTDNGIL